MEFSIILVALLASVGNVASQCKDVAQNCWQYKQNCYSEGSWKAYMQKFCQKTCDKHCTGQPLTPGPATNSPGGCTDQATNCADYKSYCFVPSWKSFMTQNCQGTCPNYCGTSPPTAQPGSTNRPPLTIPPSAPPPGSCGKPTIPNSRVIAGINAKRGSWPWMVSLNYNGYHRCGGTLITPHWVLTAAHCTHNTSPRNFQIISGEHDRSIDEGSEQQLDVKRIVNHPDYRGVNIRYDIALMELAKPVRLDTYSNLVCLPPKGFVPAEGKQCYLSGWGTTTHPGDSAKILQQAMMPVVAKKHCHDRTGFVCTGFGYTKKTNACRGDSGGPLVCQESDGTWVQQGIASFVVEYCKYYTAFTRIGDHIDWIKGYVNI